MKAKVTLTLFLILTSIALHGYLTSHYYSLHFGMASENAMCNVGESFNCDAVAASSYSSVAGIPLSVWGLITNLILLVMTMVFWLGLVDRIAAWKRWTFYIASFSAGASVVMGLISLLQLSTYCLFCIILYFLSFGIAVLLATIQDEKIGQGLLNDFKQLFMEARPLVIAIVLIPIASYLTHASIIKKYDAGELNKLVHAFVQDWKASQAYDFSTPPAFTLGADPASATMVISEFADFRCGHCKSAAPSIHAFVKSHSNEVAFKFYNFPLDNTCNTNVGQGDGVSCRIAKAVTCANEQGKAPAVHDYFFEHQSRFQRMTSSSDVDEDLKQQTTSLSISYEKLEECMNKAETHDKVSAQAQMGQTAGLRGTPTVYVNGKRLDRGQLIPVLEGALKSLKSN